MEATQAQRDAFRTFGYLKFAGAIPAIEAEAVSREFEAQMAQSEPQTPIPILVVPYMAFSGNAAGGPHQAQRRAPAPEPRWGRAVQRWLRFAVAEGPRGSLLQRYAILAPPSPVDFAHN